jgi:hypothetical protein
LCFRVFQFELGWDVLPGIEVNVFLGELEGDLVHGPFIRLHFQIELVLMFYRKRNKNQFRYQIALL